MNRFTIPTVLLASTILGACSGPPDAARPGETADMLPASADPGSRQVSSGDLATGADAGTTSGPRRVVVHGVDLTGVGYDRGDRDAPVVLVNFSDFGCPYCAQFSQESEPVIDEDYVKTGKVFMKYVPFVMGMFPNGGQAARAAECAGDQGQFKAMHDRLYADQQGWKRASDVDRLLARYASDLKLGRAEFAACYAKPGMHPRTVRATQAAENLGVRATPSFLIDDRGIEGALPLPNFREVLDAAHAGRM